jgi:F0F1-type ATP synthase membrane subunit b/b'
MQPVDQQMIPQALQLIKNKPLRNFRIEVAADSLVQLDEAAMKRERTEFIGAFAGFLQQAMPVAQASPEMTPVLMEIMKFGVSAFKSSSQLEGVIDQALDQIKQKMAQPQQPKPDPEMIKLQAQQQSEQMRVQADMQVAQAKAQFDTQLQQAKLQAEAQQLQFNAQLESAKLEREQQMERFKAELDANTKIRVAQISHSASMLPEDMDAQQQMHATLNQDLRGMIEAMMNTVNNSHQQVMQSHNHSVGTMQEMLKNQNDNTQVMKNVADMISAPKRIVRGPDGKAVGMEVIK